jgi:hypothetical protein
LTEMSWCARVYEEVIDPAFNGRNVSFPARTRMRHKGIFHSKQELMVFLLRNFEGVRRFKILVEK